MSLPDAIRVPRADIAALQGEIATIQRHVGELTQAMLTAEMPPAKLGDLIVRLGTLQAKLGQLASAVTSLGAVPADQPALTSDAPPDRSSDQPSSATDTAPQPTAPDEPTDQPIARSIPPATGPALSLSGPIVLRKAGGSSPQLPVNGLDLSGAYLLDIDAASAAGLAQQAVDPLRRVHLQKQRSQDASFGLVTGYQEDDLADARWAVVVHAEESTAILRALAPLIAHRAAAQGIILAPEALNVQPDETCSQWYARTIGSPQDHQQRWLQLPPVLIYRGETNERDRTVSGWLARHQVSIGPVDPRRGVPYYLMLAARPGPLHPQDTCYISYDFQYELDLFWGVGRLCFTDLQGQHDYAAYMQYAEQVVAFERNGKAAELLSPEITYLATRHPGDESTRLGADELVLPLFQADVEVRRSPKPFHTLTPRLYLANGRVESPRARLTDLDISGNARSETFDTILNKRDHPPAIFFAATHGVGVLDPSDREKVLMYQGALVTQDGGPGKDNTAHTFGAHSLSPNSSLKGMMAFFIACYGAGSPERDGFLFGLDHEKQRAIAPFPFVARLPQELLKRGALAVFGHIDRAWTYTFRGVDAVDGQTQSFRDVLNRLAAGKRAGYATDQFNILQAGFGLMFGNELENIRFGKRIEPYDLAMLWMARNDARNYALLGDPAVRLPFGAGSR